MEPNTRFQPRPTSVPRSFPRGAVLLWGAAAVLVLLSLPLFALFDAEQNDVGRLQAAIVQAQISRILPPSGEEISALRATATAVADAEDRLLRAVESAGRKPVSWPAVMECVIPPASSQIQLISLRQEQATLNIQGIAEGELALLAYVARLRGSPLFDDVQLISQAVTATPAPTASPSPTCTPSPSATPSPSPTATSTPTYLDAYEPDDLQPRPIELGVPQLHSFQPTFDVDRVRFVGKAAHCYRIMTQQLAPGVDTILLASVAGVNYANDDRATGDLGSTIDFCVPAQNDALVTVLVTNRGRFGADATYILTVQEIGTGDSCEPDDANPCLISPGEVQQRTFYPEGDIDRARFRVKAGHWYQVGTSHLAIGVDTSLTVQVSGAVFENDDLGPGDYASRLAFQAAADGFADVVVRNKDRYGPAASYELSVIELVGPPTSTPSPAPPAPITVTPGPGSGASWLTLTPRSPNRGWTHPAGLLAPDVRHTDEVRAPKDVLHLQASNPTLSDDLVFFIISLHLKGYEP